MLGEVALLAGEHPEGVGHMKAPGGSHEPPEPPFGPAEIGDRAHGKAKNKQPENRQREEVGGESDEEVALAHVNFPAVAGEEDLPDFAAEKDHPDGVGELVQGDVEEQ